MKIISIRNNEEPEFDRQLIASLSATGPRYTSYPTADCFHGGFREAEHVRALELRGIGALNKPLSPCIHISLCNTICYYCDYNKIITKNKNRADAYIEYLEKEMELLAPHLGGGYRPAQLCFGGDTPTFLSDDQLKRIFHMIRKHFQLISDGEYSIEIDPRRVSHDTVLMLNELGFNRMGVGIQDFGSKVQAAASRIQSYEGTEEVIDVAREVGFKSVSIDLIYGLPHQTAESIKTTIDTVLSLDLDRLVLYHYAHLPHIFKPQRCIDTDVVLGSEKKLDMLQYCVQTLTRRGYVFIGMDHFAKPDDELSVALREGLLQRNFQGYSIYANCDLVAIGVSSIGKIGSIYSQNECNIDDYYAAVDAGHLLVMRGCQLNQDDLLRRTVIQDLMCRFALGYRVYESVFGISFDHYFKEELADLQQLAELGLVRLSSHGLKVTPKGRFLIRSIAMVFDYHLRHKETKTKYSQTV